MAFILENLGLATLLVLLGWFFYRSYKVHLSIIKGSITTQMFTILNLSRIREHKL